MRTSSSGALIPVRGFTRDARRDARLPAGQACWRSHDGLLVVSSLEQAYLPGSGEPPLIGAQWLVSVSRWTGGLDRRCAVSDADVGRVVEGFAMPAFDEDNHHPGVARHLWCPIDEAYRSACECKLTELTVDDAGYRWTTDSDGACRGCEYRADFGPAFPCPLHPA